MTSSRLTIESLTLGTATLGNLFEAMDDAQAAAVLEAAWEAGVRSFDTAPHYGLGLAERRLGAFLSGMPLGSFRVSTKVGRLLAPNPEAAVVDGELPWDSDLFVVRARTRRVWSFTADGIRRSLEQSLGRLGLDRVDTLYLHDPDESPDPRRALQEGLDSLAAMRDAGTISRIGVGSKSGEALEAAVAHGAADELMVAGRHTLVDHSAAAGLLPRCLERGVGVAAAAVFNSGLLATREPSGPFEYGEAPAEVVTRARRIADVCAAHGTDLPTAALHYSALHPAVTSVVVGARTADQVRDNAERVANPPDPALWAALAAEQLVPQAVAA